MSDRDWEDEIKSAEDARGLYDIATDLLAAYDAMKEKYIQQHKAWVKATTLLEAAQRRLAADELTQEAEKLGMYGE